MYHSTKNKQDTVLIIEDNQDQWTIIKEAIRYTLPTVKAIRMMDKQNVLFYLNECIANYQSLPKLILLDLYLPSLTQGLQLLQELKMKNSRYHYLPVVILSNSYTTEDILAAYNAGCSSYLVKPITLKDWLDLFAMIKTYWWDTATIP